MYPTLYEFDGVGLHTWGLMVMLAFCVASLVLGMRAGKVGIDSDRLMPFFLLITFGGLIGSRLLHFVMAEPSLLPKGQRAVRFRVSDDEGFTLSVPYRLLGPIQSTESGGHP